MKKIISGGQTGADRAALDAALECQFPCGGWCPRDRKAEDGVIPSHYPLTEIASPDYVQRTKQNVIDSDGTVIFYYQIIEGGSDKTQDFCQQYNKPFITIDLSARNIADACNMLEEFVSEQQITVLNVAGPRASKQPLAYEQTKNVISCLLSQ